MMKVKLKKLHPHAKAPLYATSGAAGCDFYSTEQVTLQPGETKKISSGIAMEIPEGYYLKLEGRSGFSSKGIIQPGGVIDSDYRGEILVMLHNAGKSPHTIEVGDRIAQGIILATSQAHFEEVNELTETKRGEGGFSSTGIK